MVCCRKQSLCCYSLNLDIIPSFSQSFFSLNDFVKLSRAFCQHFLWIIGCLGSGHWLRLGLRLELGLTLASGEKKGEIIYIFVQFRVIWVLNNVEKVFLLGRQVLCEYLEGIMVNSSTDIKRIVELQKSFLLGFLTVMSLMIALMWCIF